ncbi:phenylalanine--tRNA ligase subunit alpha [Gammaproteobacteria bacterium]|nr:phenylalanine--tRNA ligase subunit alpha [Gammaproteobacteria bacterium]
MTAETPDTDAIQADALTRIDAATTTQALESLRVEFLGKKGALTQVLKRLGSLAPEQRREFGQAANRVKVRIEQALDIRRVSLSAGEAQQRIAAEKIDVTLPGRGREVGSLHPITRTVRRMEDIFGALGFAVASGPEIEGDWYNFEALNFPPNHPARAMHDTFFVDPETVLRTHTSPVQIRYMLDHEPPLQAIAPGRVYRCDSDMTHSPMFHQLEGLAVDRDIHFGDLKGMLLHFLKEYFETDLQLRFRPSFFPFTEPSAEVDMSCVFCEQKGCRVCSHSGWIEILGCGMVHPVVLKNGGIDPDKYSGYAFGMGIERLCMLRYGVNDLRMFFDNDLPMLRQFAAS